MLLTCEQLAAGMGAQSRPLTNVNNSTGKSPLTTSDKVNMSQNKDPFSTTKPRSKRKASEVEPDENSTPSLRPLKEKSNASDSCSQVANAIGNAQLRLWIGERFLGKSLSALVYHCLADGRFQSSASGRATRRKRRSMK